MKLTARRAATVSAALTLTMLGIAVLAQASSAPASNDYTGVRLNQQPGSAAANIGTVLSMSWC